MPIPVNLRDELAQDPFYKICCLENEYCRGGVEWHHNLIYSGKQQNYKFCILPVCQYHHKNEKHPFIRDALDKIMLARTTITFLIKTFPRRNWLVLQSYLNKNERLNKN